MSQIKRMHFSFVTQDEHDKEANLLDEWLKWSRTVPGTTKLHSFVPITTNSSSEYSRNEKVAFEGHVPS